MRRTMGLWLCAFAVGCSTQHPEGGGATAAEVRGTVLKPMPALQPATKEATDRAVAGQTELAGALYTRLAEKEKGNFVYSPASISVAFGMTYAGAQGETERQMASALRYTLPPAELHAAFGTQLARWNGNGEKRPYELAVANRLFGARQYPFKEAFLGLTAEHYRAQLEPLDFKGAPEASRLAINKWVEQRTKDHIKDLLPEGSIREATKLVLTNAVYLDAPWEQPFDPEETGDAPFTTPTSEVTVPMMHAAGQYRFAENRDAKMLELSYKGDDLVMQIVLPNDPKGLGAVEKKLVAGDLDVMASALKPDQVIVGLPKFKIEPGDPISLKSMLEEMGMVDAFDDAKADFGAMGNANGRIFLDDAFHKAFIAVHEKGTEAAAATAVTAADDSAAPEPKGKLFNADHPFVFAIRDTKTGAILFMGRVTNPA